MNRIKELRQERGLKQDALADLLSIEASAVSKLETGKVPLRDTYIVLLANFFNVSTDYLLGLSSFRKNFSFNTNDLSNDEIRELETYIEYLRFKKKRIKNPISI